jgi:SRSO17 transposase
MDAQQMRQLKPELRRFLEEFDACFPRKDTRAHLPVYVSGQLSDIPEKSVEPIALRAGVAPRTLQEFLSQHHWDHDMMRDRLEEIVVSEHGGANSIGIFDETSDVKKGDKTPGVQRQWCGTVGKTENCIVTVHLAYACGDFHCLLDSELYLPESWAQDRDRCKEAGIPEDMVYRPKWEIALELYDHALRNGLHFDWVTFDEGYGSKPGFLRGLSARGQAFVGEVQRSCMGWLKPPRVVTRAYRKNKGGRGRKTPRLASGSAHTRRVDELLQQGELRDQAWQRWRVKDGEKGPMVWDVKHVLFYPKDENGMPGAPLHLIVARDVLNPTEMKFFVSNATRDTPVQKMLLVGFSRWRVERCFEDQKGEVGLDQYEGRRYQGLKRHLILSAVSYLFLARTRQKLGGEKSRVDGVPGAYRDCCLDPVLVARQASLARGGRKNAGEDLVGAKQKRRGEEVPYQANATTTTRVRYPTHRPPSVLMGLELAL